MNKNTPSRLVIAFFDLDLTILNINSASLWIKSEYKLGYLSLWQLLRAFYWLTRYHLGSASMESALLSAFKTLKGHNVYAFNERIKNFYRDEVAHRVRSGAEQTIKSHQNQGHLCYLCTNASAALSSLFCEALQLDGMICNHFEEKEGRFTGEPATQLCFGRGKLILAKRLAAEKSTTLDHCYFYTDSYSDLPLLEAVGYPFAVHPDQRLRRLANAAKWPILNWDGEKDC